ncbi:MAG: hypothetical protein E6H77_07575 [Betaproteobacteria bacterium]|nr:MAG: hypothetical protein E6H77_07575 [Betaproteobacteria bacterium]
MNDFTNLLLAASQTLGTLLEVANALEVEPKLVYRWMAGFERPSPANVTVYKARLLELRIATRAEAGHPHRRRFDPRAA